MLNTPLKSLTIILNDYSNRVLDFWLTYICSHEALVVANYAPTSFVSISQTTARHLFLEMVSALQPLAKIPFR